jgi:hypothetical protein
MISKHHVGGQVARTLSILAASCTLTSVLVALPFATSPSVAFAADNKAEAEQVFTEGRKAMTAHAYGEARKLFTKSLALFPSLGAELNLAAAEVELSEYLSAGEHLDRVAVAMPKDDPRRELVASLTKTVDARVGRVRAEVVPKDAKDVSLSLDGFPPSAALRVQLLQDGLRVLPGDHKVHAEYPGLGVADATVRVAAGETVTARLSLAGTGRAAATTRGGSDIKDAPSESSPLKPLGFVGIGLGAAGVIAGSVFGLVASGKKTDAFKDCAVQGDPCTGDYNARGEALSDGRTMGTLSTVSFIAGGVLLAGGIVLVLIAPNKVKTVSTRGFGVAF